MLVVALVRLWLAQRDRMPILDEDLTGVATTNHKVVPLGIRVVPVAEPTFLLIARALVPLGNKVIEGLEQLAEWDLDLEVPVRNEVRTRPDAEFTRLAKTLIPRRVQRTIGRLDPIGRLSAYSLRNSSS